MDSMIAIGLQITTWLQENLSGLTGFFTLISNLGIEEFYLALLPLIYWSVDKRVGKALAFLFLLSTGH